MALPNFEHLEGTLEDAFRQIYKYAEVRTAFDMWEAGMAKSMWICYRGPTCAPFDAYIRLFKDKIVLANIVAKSLEGSVPVRKGRMPKIIDAVLAVVPRVEVESVVSRELEIFLIANDFKVIDEESRPSSYYKVRDNVVL